MAEGMGMIQAGAGATVTTIAGIVKAKKQKDLAEEQAREAEKLRRKAFAVQKPELQEEFRNVERLKALATLTGMPGYSEAESEIEGSAGTQLRAGREGAASGGDYLQYAASLYERENAAKRDLKAQQTQHKVGAMSDYEATLLGIGQEELKNKAIQRDERNKLLAQANALENAATANKYGAHETAAGATAEGAGMFVGTAAGSSSQPTYNQPKEQDYQSGNGGSGKTGGNDGSGTWQGSGKTSGGGAGGGQVAQGGAGKTSGGTTDIRSILNDQGYDTTDMSDDEAMMLFEWINRKK